MEQRPQPRPWRIVLGFIAAPLAAALCFGLIALISAPRAEYMSSLASITFYAAIVAAILTIVLGVPSFLILKSFLRPRLVYCLIVGGLVATAPLAALLLLAPLPDFASVDGRATVIAGRRTIWGIISILGFVAYIFPLGAVGGGVFWLVAVGGERPRPPQNASAPH